MGVPTDAQRVNAVIRPETIPFRLRRLCGRSKTPHQVLAEAISRHGTFVEAADELGIDVATLRRWRQRWPVEIAR